MNADCNEPNPDDPEPRRVTTEELFGTDDALVIRHGDSDYELRITRRKRLILTKRAGAES